VAIDTLDGANDRNLGTARTGRCNGNKSYKSNKSRG
jgi:hypothetical protein